jgi:hypothetical protein
MSNLSEKVSYAEYAPKTKRAPKKQAPPKGGAYGPGGHWSPQKDQLVVLHAPKVIKALTPKQIKAIKSKKLGWYRALIAASQGMEAYREYIQSLSNKKESGLWGSDPKKRQEYADAERLWMALGYQKHLKKVKTPIGTIELSESTVNESTMSGNVIPNMQLGSAFIQRPGNHFGITELERVEEPKMPPVTPHVGVDNQGKLAYTIEDLLGHDDLSEIGIEEGKGKKKLHPEMEKHTDSPSFKAHVGDSDDSEKPFHKGKGIQKEDFDADSSKVIAKLKALAKPFGAKFKIASNAPHFLVSTDKDVEMLLHKVKKVYPDLAKPKTGYTVMKHGKKQVVIFKPRALVKYESVVEKIKTEGSQSWKKITGKLKAGKKGAMARADAKQAKAGGRPNPEGDFVKTGRDSGYNKKDPRREAHKARRGKKTKGESLGFDPKRGFFLSEKTHDGKLTDKEQSVLNKKQWKEWGKKDPKKKSEYTGDKPMPSHGK